jgi:hypothetical protein
MAEKETVKGGNLECRFAKVNIQACKSRGYQEEKAEMSFLQRINYVKLSDHNTEQCTS